MDSLNPQPNPNYVRQHVTAQPNMTAPQQGNFSHGAASESKLLPPPYPGYHLPQPPVNTGPQIVQSLNVVGDDVDVKFFDFSDQSIRRNFVKKVYGILSCQLLLTLAVIAFFIYCRPVKEYVSRNLTMLYVALGVYIALAIVLLCITEARRKAPLNYILLFVFTGATSYMMGAVSASLDASEVMIAVGVTALICFSLTLFAFQTKYDFTTCNGFMLCILVALLFLGISCAIYPSRSLHMVYTAAGIVVFSFSLVYHTQLIMGGRHKYAVTPEEYVFAALTLYLDVINIFLRVLRMMR